VLSPSPGWTASVDRHAVDRVAYERHYPQDTLLYPLIEKHYPFLVEQLVVRGRSLPTHVHLGFDAYLKSENLLNILQAGLPTSANAV
jgi:hypothetical protein